MVQPAVLLFVSVVTLLPVVVAAPTGTAGNSITAVTASVSNTRPETPEIFFIILPILSPYPWLFC
jgi:hypothetical protein